MNDPIETKLAAARTKLILDKPFLGALVLRLPLKAAKPDWCPTTATDARHFYYNPEYIGALGISETQFILAHEALHCALSHFTRRGHRLQHRWDLACDLAINPLLLDDGLKPPPNAIFLDEYRDMTAEEIYPLLDEQDDEMDTLDQHLYDPDNREGSQKQNRPPPKSDQGEKSQGERPERPDRQENDSSGSGQAEPDRGQDAGQDETSDGAGDNGGDNGAEPPPPLSQQERDTLQVQWQQRLAGAAQQALQAGKLGGKLARLIDHLLQPQLPWRNLLAHHISNRARDDFSYMRPSRREGSAILPSLRSGQIDLVVAVDTSGSVKDGEIERFLAEIQAIKGQIRARICLLACDAELAKGAPWIYEPWEEFRRPPEVKGGGGTDFRPVFHWIDRHLPNPELLVYFTDAKGSFPDKAPSYPVLWLIKGKEKVPWGQRIQLN
ncbi:hypothetical protein D5125_16310 [Magnetovirga frankeli]|uniref:vWA domain-containing protein n=1 Tax=Magnetovirga frankeli TaxID=947516 RepID=UPI001293A005|nr:hypothetical protein D5125_16310 [gamma proteobacterium SS-5]